MTGTKMLAAIAVCRQRLRALDIPQTKHLPDQLPATVTDILAHCHAMLDEMEVFVGEGRPEKAGVWLGFVQGCLWSCRMYTIDQLREQNRPDAERLTE